MIREEYTEYEVKLDEIVEILKYESCRFSETVTTQCLDPRGTSHGVDRACMMWQPLLC